jgi:hypothetical protein
MSSTRRNFLGALVAGIGGAISFGGQTFAAAPRPETECWLKDVDQSSELFVGDKEAQVLCNGLMLVSGDDYDVTPKGIEFTFFVNEYDTLAIVYADEKGLHMLSWQIRCPSGLRKTKTIKTPDLLEC